MKQQPNPGGSFNSGMDWQMQRPDGHDQPSRERNLRGGREENRGPPSAFDQRPDWAPRNTGNEERDRSPLRSSAVSRLAIGTGPTSGTPEPAPQPVPSEPEVVGDVVTIDDLVSTPGRFMRPPKIAIILRGPPGSGKTTMAKMIKDREVENGGSPPRILSLDDYFMVETEKMTLDKDTGRRVKTKIMEYEYEAELEDSYRASLVKSFKKQVDDGFFPFIIVDCVNNKVNHFTEIASHAKKQGF
ncbi:hypothetical protein OTU49_015030, partial [Cherax quadricarinatus]